jgi:hypothetical protein
MLRFLNRHQRKIFETIFWWEIFWFGCDFALAVGIPLVAWLIWRFWL